MFLKTVQLVLFVKINFKCNFVSFILDSYVQFILFRTKSFSEHFSLNV